MFILNDIKDTEYIMTNMSNLLTLSSKHDVDDNDAATNYNFNVGSKYYDYFYHNKNSSITYFKKTINQTGVPTLYKTHTITSSYDPLEKGCIIDYKYGHVINYLCVNMKQMKTTDLVTFEYCNKTLLNMSVQEIINIVRLDGKIYDKMINLYTNTGIFSLPVQHLLMKDNYLYIGGSNGDSNDNSNSNNIPCTIKITSTCSNMYVTGNACYLETDEKRRYEFSSSENLINAYKCTTVDDISKKYDLLAPVYDIIYVNDNYIKCENVYLTINDSNEKMYKNEMKLYFNDGENLSNSNLSSNKWLSNALYLTCNLSSPDHSTNVLFMKPIVGGFKHGTKIQFNTTGNYILRHVETIYMGGSFCIISKNYVLYDDLPEKYKYLMEIQKKIKENKISEIQMLKINMPKEYSYPLTITDDGNYEGFWYNLDEENTKYPIPIPGSDKICEEFLIKFKKVTEYLKKTNNCTNYLGTSPCRLNNSSVPGSCTFYFNSNETKYSYPEGLVYYYEKFNVEPSSEFKNAIMNFEFP